MTASALARPPLANLLAVLEGALSKNGQTFVRCPAIQSLCTWQVMESLDLLLPALLDSLNAPSERVVVESLTVQASIAEDEDRFRHLMDLLLDRYFSSLSLLQWCIALADLAVGAMQIFLLTRFRGAAGGRLLSRRGSLVVRSLAELLGGKKVFCALSASLEHEDDLQFAASVVQALNLILLTAPEVQHS